MIAAAFALALAGAAAPSEPPSGLPDAFVRLSEVAPTIVQDMRYAGAHNFTGRPVPGYDAPTCILTRQAAEALAGVHAEMEARDLTLIVWDCYRPARSVAAFVAWAEGPDETAKAEFFPRVPKSELFARGYIAARSGHSAGSTVDLGIAPRDLATAPAWSAEMGYVECIAPAGERFPDGALDFGTGYDCFDALAHGDAVGLSDTARANRAALREAMIVAGFAPYAEEWWHFTLADQPFPGAAFDFPVR